MAKTTDPFNFKMPKLPTIKGIKAPKGWGMPRQGTIKRDEFANPPGWYSKKYPLGSQPEWAVYRALLSMGLKDGTDFIFKPQQLPFALVVFPATGSVLIIQDGVTQNNKLSQIATLSQAGLKAVYVSTVNILVDPVQVTRDAISGRSPNL